MAREEKPYRVYRGGRAKGKVPTTRPRAGRAQRSGSGDAPGEPGDYRGPGASTAGRQARWGLRIGLGVAVLFVVIVVWGIASWLSFSSGVSDANKRLDPNAKLALAHQGGLLLSHSTTILMLGTDNA